MKNNISFLIISSLLFAACATDKTGLDFLTKIFSSGGGSLTEQDASDAIKEALLNGTQDGVRQLSMADGYFGNPEIRIPLPPDATEMSERLRSIGLGNQVDQALESLNRAAEAAATEAGPIFIDAIKKMTIADAINIVRGTDDAATRYLEKHSSAGLKGKFQPAISSSLDRVSATKYWAAVTNSYNKLPMVSRINPNLPEYVTTKAIEGLFVMIAREELAIRNDPSARTSQLLKKVFGN